MATTRVLVLRYLRERLCEETNAEMHAGAGKSHSIQDAFCGCKMSQLPLPLTKTVVNPSAGTSICAWRRKPSDEGQAGVAEQGIASQEIGSPRASVKLPVGGDGDDDDDDKGCEVGLVVRITTRTFRCCNKEL